MTALEMLLKSCQVVGRMAIASLAIERNSMSAIRITLVLLSGLLVWIPSANPVRACGIAAPRDFEATVASETALIVYDAATKTEHFLRLAKFDTTSADFGFFVPTPSQPELAEASAAIFPMLGKITEPVTVHRTVRQGPGIGCAGGSVAAKWDSAGMSMPIGVRVIEQKRIGAFDASVLKAESVPVLQAWLKENGYSTRPALEAWFAEYIRLGWYIAAFKVAGGNPTTDSANTPVRISFKTDVPVYPYREPLDQKPPRKGRYSSRLLRLFVLSEARVEGRLGTVADAKPFAGQAVWSKPVDAATIGPALAAGKFQAMTADWHLTEFEDPSDPRVGTDDLYFSKSASQLPIERPPHEIITVVTTYWGVGALCTGFALLPLLLLYGGYRLGRGYLRRWNQK